VKRLQYEQQTTEKMKTGPFSCFLAQRNLLKNTAPHNAEHAA